MIRNGQPHEKCSLWVNKQESIIKFRGGGRNINGNFVSDRTTEAIVKLPQVWPLKGDLTTPLNRKFLSVLINSRLEPHEATFHQVWCVSLMGSFFAYLRVPCPKGGLTTPLNRKFWSVLIDSRLGPHETTFHQILCILLMGSELMLSDQFRRPPLAACTRAGDLTKVILNQDTIRSHPICSNNLSLMGSLFRP